MSTQTLHQRRAIRAYVKHGAHPDPMVRYELDRAARAEMDDLLRNPCREAPRVTFAPSEPLPSLWVRAIEGLRAEFGATWPAWALGFLLLCVVSAIATVLLLTVLAVKP